MESFEITPLDGQITTEVNFDVVEPIIVATELPSDPRNVEVYDFNTNVVTTYPYKLSPSVLVSIRNKIRGELFD